MKNKRSRIKVSKIFIMIFFLCFVCAIVKVLFVSLSKNVDGVNLTVFANNRNTVKKTLYASRGNIYDSSKC